MHKTLYPAATLENVTSTSARGSLRSRRSHSTAPVLGVDKSRLEAGFRELEGKAVHSPCWREAVNKLDLSCKQLCDLQQSRLAVAFANCHLDKSGRQTYPCSDEMSIRECTEDMDHDAYQTYTHFFTHTGHICYFLQIEVWQGRTVGLIGRLSDTSSQAVEKLEQSLEYHRIMDDKQDSALRNQDLILEQDRRIAASLQETHKEMAASFSEMSASVPFPKAASSRRPPQKKARNGVSTSDPEPEKEVMEEKETPMRRRRLRASDQLTGQQVMATLTAASLHPHPPRPQSGTSSSVQQSRRARSNPPVEAGTRCYNLQARTPQQSK